MTDSGKVGSDYGAVMAIEDLSSAIEWQAEHAEINDAPCTARVIRSLTKVAAGETATGRRIAGWHGLTLKDAMPLRIAGGLHHLVLSGEDDRLARVYSGQITDQGQVDRLVCELVETYDHRLLPWLDGPPQTNEAGRSASIMAGLLWLAQRVAPRFELLELGASAGVNTMLNRYRFRLGDTEVGPADSPMRIEPEWRGGAGSPPNAPDEFKIVSVRGCDVAPINLADEASALRLKSYVWPDAPARMARIDAAIELASQDPPQIVRKDAGEFVGDMLSEPQAEGTTRAMFHSIMWQYMPAETQEAITQMVEREGTKASAEKPLAWISLETDPATFRHELKVRYWNGGESDGETTLLSHAHPHGAWVEWAGSA
ncbi:hypothetical protein NAP1_01890 [Erythrobacter sp. NAP1]|uniref:DUF2332 domain-containing protein n=1 Tax=Erythrobacter sp. NAP1 TaxID=237727 RepID=UPI0000686B44|nr:DUF2332 domain-containing protein [Erythrobacter sp. NAP1]EAQ29484.1 hypothetical protein NAP1_01890 [Erythrobacter sp. NAP1]